MCPDKIPVSKKADEIPPFLVMDVLERAFALTREGVDVIHLEVGEPDFDTPGHITDAGLAALREGKTHYTASTGIHELREAVARYHGRMYGVDVDPDCVIVTSGSSPAIFLALASLLDPGEEIILSDPHYACYPNFIRFLGGVPVYVPARSSEGFQMDPDEVRASVSERTRAILINSPSNPTGVVMDPDRMASIARIGVPIISDEIYHGLVYEGRERSILEFTDRAFVVNGFSKLFAMTGWRLGYLIAPKPNVRPIQKMVQNFFISAADFVQYAGVAALTRPCDETENMKRMFNERRLAMLPRLKAMGFEVLHDPTAAFYILADARRFSCDSLRFAFEILEDAAVGVSPGIDFGARAEGFIRFSYTNSMENIMIGLDRLSQYLKKRFGRHTRPPDAPGSRQDRA
jgi:aspartate/methionine/tyrosine aminotransferase